MAFVVNIASAKIYHTFRQEFLSNIAYVFAIVARNRKQIHLKLTACFFQFFCILPDYYGKTGNAPGALI